MKEIQKYLEKHGIKPSAQRLAVMKYLLENPTHPTVDEIYNALLPEIPTLSRTTVYNTLRLLVEHGAAIHIGIDEKNARFDGTVESHAHFRCSKCGCIMDVHFNIQKHLPADVRFTINQTHLYLEGICEKCK